MKTNAAEPGNRHQFLANKLREADDKHEVRLPLAHLRNDVVIVDIAERDTGDAGPSGDVIQRVKPGHGVRRFAAHLQHPDDIGFMPD